MDLPESCGEAGKFQFGNRIMKKGRPTEIQTVERAQSGWIDQLTTRMNLVERPLTISFVIGAVRPLAFYEIHLDCLCFRRGGFCSP